MVENSLFNQPLMNKYLKKYKKELKLTHTRKKAVLKWIKKLQNDELKDEVANYGSFSRIILEDILGYDYEENIKENVKEDYGRGFSEFAIKKDNKNFMVIELKGSATDLDKPQQRKTDKRTPVDQAFDYAKRSGDINWIFLSNYKEFRLYNWHKKQHQYISFKAEELKDPETFKSFMLVFSKFSTIDHNLIEKLVSKTVFVERDLEAEFYKLFNETRLMLIAELEHIHPEFTRDESVHYAQLILNRYIFICFAEDLGLLPGEISVEGITNTVKNNELGHSEIWHKLNRLFIDVNEGNNIRKDKIYGYNGGLFEEDLEFLKIRDVIDDYSIFKDAYQKWKFEEYSLIVEEKLSPYNDKINPIYKNLMTISTFNFSSEVDVNILGHIFENSIGDIEELKANEKGRRKKEGIFYTPENITDYICRNTIIPYLSKSGNFNTVTDLIGEYWGSTIEELEEKVKNIKIVDPACGSGAFLNKASDILLEIHDAIRQEKYKDDKTLIPHFDSIKERRKILLNNIYGVDLNEESVEITKLSLFLKVSRKGLKLPNLDANIKCGNSLIDDPEYTNKPFKWKTEFKDIFTNGGFDVVVGNPPYVRHHKIKDAKPYLKEKYKTFAGLADLYVYFFEKGLDILKTSGMFAFICSNAFITVNYGKNLRQLILDNKFKKYLDYTGKGVFEDAKVDPSIIVLQKGSPSPEEQVLINNEYQIPQKSLDNSNWTFRNPKTLKLKQKIIERGVELKDTDINIFIGIFTGYNNAFFINKEVKDNIIKEDPKSKEVIRPLLRGRDVSRWKISYNDLYLLYIPWKFPIENYPAIKNHLNQFRDKLENRSTVRNGGAEWYALQRYASDYIEEFDKPKLIYREISSRLFAVYDENKYITNAKCFIITSETTNLKYLNTLMCSKLLDFVFKLIGTPLARTSANKTEIPRYSLSKSYIEQLPIYQATPEKQQPLIEKADRILQLNQNLQEEINGFKHWIQKEFNVKKLSQKLEKYYELSEDEFIDQLKKKKVNTKKRTNREYLEREFADSLTIINPLIEEIKQIDNEIDLMIYALYNLNKEEIEIIENSLIE